MQTVILSIVFTSHNSFNFRSDGRGPSPYAYNCSLPVMETAESVYKEFAFLSLNKSGSSFFKPAVENSIIPHIAARKTPRIIATFIGSIYGDFLYLGDYSNINNYNISFHFCQYICPKFWSAHKKLNPKKRREKPLCTISVFIIAHNDTFVNFFPDRPPEKIRKSRKSFPPEKKL